MQWEPIIGLEVHVQLNTKSKIFSGAATAFGAEPNTQACIIDLGFPGVLPTLNEEVVRKAVKFGLSINAQIAKTSIFARKNYFYPDLPKGYQISQYEHPIILNGTLEIDLPDNSSKKIRIARAHLEEDAGKSLHEDFNNQTGIDLNRAGTPLLEIVSEPDLYSAEEAISYLKTLHALVCYLDICDGNMQEGSFRCDANVSVRRVGDLALGTRTEIKNVNSFRFVEKAINYEIARHIEVLSSGGKIQQETRLYDSDRNVTRAMRAKDDAKDYRYFPDPDLLPLILEENFIQSIRAQLPELPKEKLKRFISQYELSEYDAKILTAVKELADYYETAVAASQGQAKLTANWITAELLGALNKANLEITHCPIKAEYIGKLVARIKDATISGKIAKEIFALMWESHDDPDTIIAARGIQQITDHDAINKIIDEILTSNQDKVADYLSGKDKLFGFFVGQIMKASQGKANPQNVNDLLKQKLESYKK